MVSGPTIARRSEMKKQLAQQNNQYNKYDKGCHNRPTDIANIIKDAIAEQLIQQIW